MYWNMITINTEKQCVNLLCAGVTGSAGRLCWRVSQQSAGSDVSPTLDDRSCWCVQSMAGWWTDCRASGALTNTSLIIGTASHANVAVSSAQPIAVFAYTKLSLRRSTWTSDLYFHSTRMLTCDCGHTAKNLGHVKCETVNWDASVPWSAIPCANMAKGWCRSASLFKATILYNWSFSEPPTVTEEMLYIAVVVVEMLTSLTKKWIWNMFWFRNSPDSIYSSTKNCQN